MPWQEVASGRHASNRRPDAFPPGACLVIRSGETDLGSAMFDALGLGGDAIAVYRALINTPAATHTQLAERIGIPHEELHNVLDVLEGKGLLRRSHDDPAGVRIESPQVAFERILSEEEIKLHRAQEQLSSVRTGAAQLVDEYLRSVNRRRGEVEHLTGTDEIVARLLELGQNITKSLDSIVTNTPTQHQLDQAKSDEARDLARGVAIRTIYPASARHDNAVVEYAAWLRDHGGATRAVVEVPNRILIYDREVAVLMFDPEDYTRGAVIINTPGMMAALRALFELLWESGTDLAPTEDDEALKPEERELLQLLARGMKDEAIGRQLGISIRTVRRMINTLSSRMDTTSRFALGARAVTRGWL
ncbi:helix-turn-helix transcriptional regulator [Georgenia yuyongxinii]|uniref:Helix-turn-helix transcriptional regulator n=2 Tax=Georgenia yuyongxinii TaxID=2589797 RepID=A0A5B8C713_9MICO|nr:helix-turn-helix transcriptional regulator [Georgenia yuyongxinii]